MERSFHRSMGSLADVFAFVDESLAGQPVPPGPAYAVRMALEELFTNAVKHGPRNAPNVLISVEHRGKEIAVAFTEFDVDRFDIREAPAVDVERPLDERTPGGLGIHLVRQVVDRIEYEYSGRTGRTTLVKTLE